MQAFFISYGVTLRLHSGKNKVKVTSLTTHLLSFKCVILILITGCPSSGPQEPNDFPNWPTGYNSKGRRRIRFDEHVKFLGGEYFFAPSMSGLRELGNA